MKEDNRRIQQDDNKSFSKYAVWARFVHVISTKNKKIQ